MFDTNLSESKSILFLTKYDETGPSSRYRTYQYLPMISGINFTISPLLSEQYLIQRFKKGRFSSYRLIISAYLKRILLVLSAKKFDLLVVEYELFPYIPAIFESYLKFRNIPYVVDYDDAIFHQYDHHSNLLIRKLLGRKISKVMKYSSQVIAGNQYIADYAEQVGTESVCIIPTVINLSHYQSTEIAGKNEVFTIVWIGSASTTKYLVEVIPSLQLLSLSHSVKLLLIGSSDIDIPGVNVERRDWEQSKEFEYISEGHVGIMPLPDTPWTRGKCGFKLIQYMACALPVVASPVGVNSEIVPGNGLLASNTDEWVTAIKFLYENPEKAREFGIKGKETVMKKYSSEATVASYNNLLLPVS